MLLLQIFAAMFSICAFFVLTVPNISEARPLDDLIPLIAVGFAVNMWNG